MAIMIKLNNQLEGTKVGVPFHKPNTKTPF